MERESTDARMRQTDRQDHFIPIIMQQSRPCLVPAQKALRAASKANRKHSKLFLETCPVEWRSNQI